MQSAQESLAELRAAIRYCENAISAAESTIESTQQAMNSQESTGREKRLESALDDANSIISELRKREEELESKVQGQYDDIVQLERENAKLREASTDKPTMLAIPRDVAIAIFREGIKQGVEDACYEIESRTIYIEEDQYVGNFEVSFKREIELSDELNLGPVRDEVGSYDEESVTYNLKGLCENLNFEYRIQGIDDNE